MFNRIRSLLWQDDDPIGGTVELDETYVGGRRKGTTGRPSGRDKKVPVFGMAQRHRAGRPGKIVVKQVANAQMATLMPHVTKKVLPETMVYTDEFYSYQRLGRMGYGHDRVRHSEKVYVSGDVHTNTVEGFWALLKGGISGVYHGVSTQHLQSYLDEYAFRYNNREATGRGMFDAILSRIENTPRAS